jgi:DNA invertase Pin-like site-specific DNA recombinase
MNYIAYYRVSTDKQGKSGLGIDAQKKQVQDFITGCNGNLRGEYTEIESGKQNDRPELAKAIRQAQLTGSKLVIAKLDRLSRSLYYITSLAESRIDFVVCDLPGCDQFTINLYGALAQRERELISQRTKSALQAAKARGKKLGTNNLKPELVKVASEKGVKIIKARADEFASRVMPVISAMQEQGKGLREIARELTNLGVKTARGKEEWTPSAVKNAINRAA